MITRKKLIEKILDTVYRNEKVTDADREWLDKMMLSDLKKMYDKWKEENDCL